MVFRVDAVPSSLAAMSVIVVQSGSHAQSVLARRPSRIGPAQTMIGAIADWCQATKRLEIMAGK